jgi:hypothetical protein
MSRARLSSPKLAAQLGIGAAFVRHWRNGVKPIPQKHLVRLIPIFEARLAELAAAPAPSPVPIKSWKRKIGPSRSPGLAHKGTAAMRRANGRVGAKLEAQRKAERRTKSIDPTDIDRKRPLRPLKPEPVPAPVVADMLGSVAGIFNAIAEGLAGFPGYTAPATAPQNSATPSVRPVPRRAPQAPVRQAPAPTLEPWQWALPGYGRCTAIVGQVGRFAAFPRACGKPLTRQGARYCPEHGG